MKSKVIIILLVTLLVIVLAVGYTKCQETSQDVQTPEQQGDDEPEGSTVNLSPGDEEDTSQDDIPYDINVRPGGQGGGQQTGSGGQNALRGFNLLHKTSPCKPDLKMMLACSKCPQRVISLDSDGCLVCSCAN